MVSAAGYATRIAQRSHRAQRRPRQTLTNGGYTLHSHVFLSSRTGLPSIETAANARTKGLQPMNGAGNPQPHLRSRRSACRPAGRGRPPSSRVDNAISSDGGRMSSAAGSIAVAISLSRPRISTGPAVPLRHRENTKLSRCVTAPSQDPYKRGLHCLHSRSLIFTRPASQHRQHQQHRDHQTTEEGRARHQEGRFTGATDCRTRKHHQERD